MSSPLASLQWERPVTLKEKALQALKALQQLELEEFPPQPVPKERWNTYPIPKRISTTQMLGNGIGNNPGYSALEVFIAPAYPAFKVMPFMEIGGVYFTDETFGAKLGIGGRYLSNTSFPLIGFNAFYDYRQGDYGSFHQLGLGFELTSPRGGISFNGYMPVGQEKKGLTCVFDDYIGDYKAVNRQFETSSKGCNATINILALRQGQFFLYTSGGPYFYARQGASPAVFGGLVTLQPQYKDYISVSFTISHDPVFGTLFQGGISLSLPLYSLSRLKNKKGPGGLSNRQIYQSVNRMPTIPLQRRCCWESNF